MASSPGCDPSLLVRTDGFTVFIANLRSYHKTVEIAANSRVELCYLDGQHDQVRITGNAELACSNDSREGRRRVSGRAAIIVASAIFGPELSSDTSGTLKIILTAT